MTKEEKEKLLAVLKLSEEEQLEWCEKKGLLRAGRKPPNAEVECSCKAFISIPESLADLAFRLRSEVELYQWNCAISWIIASLIAQSEEKK